MGRRDARHGARWAFWLPVVLVVALLAAAGTAYWLDRDSADPRREPAAVAPPPGLELPALTAPAPVAEPATGRADPAKVRRAVAAALRDPDLGPHVLATVADLNGTLLYSRGTGEAVPASTLKLLTAAAALQALGPEHTFATTVVSGRGRSVVLVGGGDPLLASERPDRTAAPQTADIVTLANATAAELRAAGTTRVRVGYDATLFAGPDVNPYWPDSYLPDGVVAPIQALWVDEGRPAEGFGRVADPAAAAARAFADALARAGITLVGEPRPQRAPADAAELARVTSPPLAQIVEHAISTSDNEASEVLARQTALAVGEPASFAGAARAVRQVVASLGVPVDGAVIRDGSGLSRENRLDPDTLTGLLEVAAAPGRPELRAVLTGLPVAGFSGSLSLRYTQAADADGRGYVRAKTGTLTGVSGLAGTVTDRSGAPLVFAFLADDIDPVDTLDARAALDRVTAELAGCRCAG